MNRNFNPLREDVRRYIKKKVLKIISEAYMDEESEDEESLNFYDFVDILEKNGWDYIGWSEVTGPQGQKGVRYPLYQHKGASSFDDLISQLQQAAVSPDCVIPTQGVNRYAPEQKVSAVIILN